jgi:hypothetical protein
MIFWVLPIGRVHFLCMSSDTNQRKHIPQSSPEGSLVFDEREPGSVIFFNNLKIKD